VPRPVAPQTPPAAAPATPASRELSGLALLLAQLDELLRDPTLTDALKRFAAKLGDGLREMLRAIASLRLRLSRRLLLALLLLTLPFALAALLLNSGDDDRAAPDVAGQAPPGPSGASLGSVGMPQLSSAPDEVKPVDVALVLDGTYGPAAQRRELRALGTWLDEHHAAGTRVSVIDARTGRASAPLRPAQLAGARTTRPRQSTAAAVGSAFERARGRRLVVSLGSPAPPSGASTLSIQTRRGAGSEVLSRSGRRSRATIDDRRPEALAASVARGIMQISGQSERR